MLVCIQVLHHQNSYVGNKVKRRAHSSPVSPSPPPPLHQCQPPKPAALNIEQMLPLLPAAPPPPPPDFPPTLQTEGSGGNLAHEPPIPPAPPSSSLPMLKEGGDGVLGLEEISRGVKLRKIEKRSCELYIDVPRQSLLKQIQQGVKLKPVSCYEVGLLSVPSNRPVFWALKYVSLIELMRDPLCSIFFENPS